MLYGLGLSSETLSIESELFYVHHQANELDQRKAFLNKEIESLTQKQEMLFSEIRPSPTGKVKKFFFIEANPKTPFYIVSWHLIRNSGSIVLTLV